MLFTCNLYLKRQFLKISIAKNVLIILLLGWLNVSFSQNLTKKQLDNGFANAETIGGKKKEKLYVLNGVPFDNSDSVKLDSALAEFDLKYLVSLEILKCPNPNFSHCYKDVILIQFATQQKSKTRRKIWHRAKRFIKENDPRSSPLFGNEVKPFSLSINNGFVSTSQIRAVLKSIKVKDIYYVASEEINDNTEGIHSGAILRIWKTLL